MRYRDPAWLAGVRAPGPNGRTFPVPHAFAAAAAAAGGGIMEDDVSTSLFTPGCAAYAGYDTGGFANMAAVRAYAASQGAIAFSYTGDSGDARADALDIEPGLASPSAGPAFYAAKGGAGVHLYCSASASSAVISYMTGAGHARSSWKLVSAHYTGPHICEPSSCGYPAADATQFTDQYLGRSLDATLLSPGFFAQVPTSGNPWPLGPGSSGPDVTILQQNLNRWRYAVPPLAADGAFGPATLAAVERAQGALRMAVTGTVDEALWKALAAAVTVPPPPPPPAPLFSVPAGLSASAHPVVNVSWHASTDASGGTSPHYRYFVKDSSGGVVAGGVVTVPGAQGVELPAPGSYVLVVQAAGNSPFSPPHPFTA